jgi:hypothetical protein
MGIFKRFSFYLLIIYQLEYVHSGNITKKGKNIFSKRIKFFPIFKALNYMGCFPAGPGYNVLDNGLTLTMVNSLSSPPPAYYTSNGYYLVLYTSMTLELCISICQTNGFMYAGLQTHAATE